jgi:hypothetical protein
MTIDQNSPTMKKGPTHSNLPKNHVKCEILENPTRWSCPQLHAGSFCGKKENLVKILKIPTVEWEICLVSGSLDKNKILEIIIIIQ